MVGGVHGHDAKYVAENFELKYKVILTIIIS